MRLAHLYHEADDLRETSVYRRTPSSTMSSNNNNLQSLRQPQPLESTLASQRQEYDDCTPCRLMGSAAFTGLGIYTYASGMSQLREREVEIANQVVKTGSRFGLGARKMAIFGMSAGLVGAGVYRLVN